MNTEEKKKGFDKVAEDLRNEMEHTPYFTSIGKGKDPETKEPCLYLYVKKTNFRKYQIEEYKGYRVIVKEMGTPRVGNGRCCCCGKRRQY